MKRILKNRLVVGFAAIFLALIVCFVAVPMMYNDRAELVEVVRVTGDIDAGSVIKDNQLETVTVGGYNLPPDVIKDKAKAVGQVALTAMVRGDYVLAAKVGTEFENSAGYFTTLSGEQLAVSIAVSSLAAGLSGQLQVNDIISIIALDDDDQAYIPAELRYVKIIATTTGEGAAPDEESLASTVTILATPEQAILIAKLHQSTTHFVLVYRGDSAKAQEYLDQQSATLAELKALGQPALYGDAGEAEAANDAATEQDTDNTATEADTDSTATD